MDDSYDFEAQRAQGEQGEDELDRFFARWFAIQPATGRQQRQGIDRLFTARRGRRRFAVEYKTDRVAAQTGNAFIETVSVDTAERAGWVYTSQADLLMYYVPDWARIYVIELERLREQLAAWCALYPLRRIPNAGYSTHGVIVPLQSLKRVARRVLTCA